MPTGEVRARLVNSAAFEPLWDPVALAREGALPGEVAAEVEAAAAAGDLEAAKQVREGGSEDHALYGTQVLQACPSSSRCHANALHGLLCVA